MVNNNINCPFKAKGVAGGGLGISEQCERMLYCVYCVLCGWNIGLFTKYPSKELQNILQLTPNICIYKRKPKNYFDV